MRLEIMSLLWNRSVRRRCLLFVFLLLTSIGIRYSEASSRSYSAAELQSVETQQEAQLRELRKQEVAQLQLALNRRLPENRKAEFYFRLAELYLEKYRAAFLLEGRAHDRRLAKGTRGQAIDRSYSRPFLQKAISSAEDILKNRLPFSEMDRIYYFLGYNYGEFGDQAKSHQYYRQLVSQHGSSRYAVEALRELGDDAAMKNNHAEARAFYVQAIQSGQLGAMEPEVLHKLAWSQYRGREYAQAIESMKKAVEKAKKSDERFLLIREEALRDLAVFFTEQGQANEALRYFRRAAGDGDYYATILERLGREYERKVQRDEAVKVYETLLEVRPSGEASFRVLVKLVDLDLRRNDYQKALSRLADKSIPRMTEQSTEISYRNLRSMIRRVATEHHEKYRKDKKVADLEVADRYYSFYLSRLIGEEKDAREIPEIQMYLAEVRRDLKQFQDAADLYERVVKSRDDRYLKESAALWVASLSDLLATTAQSENQSSHKSKKEPTVGEKQFVQAADQLSGILPESEQARESVLRSAQMMADYPASQRGAIQRIERLISSYPQSRQSVLGARLWLQILTDRLPDVKTAQESDILESSRALEEVLDHLKKNSVLLKADERLQKGELKAQIESLELRLLGDRIELFEKKKDYVRAGKAYETYAFRVKEQSEIEEAWRRSLRSYVSGQSKEDAARLSNQWLQRNPQSKEAHEAIQQAASAFFVDGEFIGSANLFEILGIRARQEAPLLTAARIYRGAGDPERSLLSYRRYLENFSGSETRWEVAMAMAQLFEEKGNDADAVKAYEVCLLGRGQLFVECASRLGDLYLRSQDLPKAKAAYERVTSLRSTRSPYIAYAHYQVAELNRAELSLVRLEGDVSRIQKQIEERVASFEKMNEWYMPAVDAGGPWAVAALSALANAAMDFSQGVGALKAPEESKAEEVARFNRMRDSISEPLRQQAFKTWAQAFTMGQSAVVLSPTLIEVHDTLADYQVAGFSRAQGPRGGLRLSGVSPHSDRGDRESALQETRQRLKSNSQEADAWIDYGNLLWGERRPYLSEIAYERAVAIRSDHPGALNNLGVIQVSGSRQEDWTRAQTALSLFDQALQKESGFLPAQMNRASLLSYYRLFEVSQKNWEAILKQRKMADAFDGLGVALQARGEHGKALEQFRNAVREGAAKSRFVQMFHEAAQESINDGRAPRRCRSTLRKLSRSGLQGFEKTASDRLLTFCEERI
jgi:cellulose synthase operon protein C